MEQGTRKASKEAPAQQDYKQTLGGIRGPAVLVRGEVGQSGGWRWLGEVQQVEVGVTASLLGRKELGY